MNVDSNSTTRSGANFAKGSSNTVVRQTHKRTFEYEKGIKFVVGRSIPNHFDLINEYLYLRATKYVSSHNPFNTVAREATNIIEQYVAAEEDINRIKKNLVASLKRHIEYLKRLRCQKFITQEEIDAFLVSLTDKPLVEQSLLKNNVDLEQIRQDWLARNEPESMPFDQVQEIYDSNHDFIVFDDDIEVRAQCFSTDDAMEIDFHDDSLVTDSPVTDFHDNSPATDSPVTDLHVTGQDDNEPPPKKRRIRPSTVTKTEFTLSANISTKGRFMQEMPNLTKAMARHKTSASTTCDLWNSGVKDLGGIKPGDTRLLLDPSKLRRALKKLTAEASAAVDFSAIDAIYYDSKYNSVIANANSNDTLQNLIMIEEEQTTMVGYPGAEFIGTASTSSRDAASVAHELVQVCHQKHVDLSKVRIIASDNALTCVSPWGGISTLIEEVNVNEYLTLLQNSRSLIECKECHSVGYFQCVRSYLVQQILNLR